MSNRRTNRAWVFDDTGVPRADYSKQHLIPLLNWMFRPGHDDALVTIDGARYGIAICKDLDFPSLARGYAQRGAQALLVPALDLGLDGPWHARMAVLRGVEQGLSVIRSANDGIMSISDAHGRMLAQTPSGRASIATLTARAPLGSGPTPYGRIGDLFGWACVTLTALVLLWRYCTRASHPR